MTIRPHPHGGFYTTLRVNGKKNFIYGTTPEEVDTKYTEMKYKHHQGYNVTSNPKMEDYMIDWFKAFKKGKGAIKTQKMYQNCINNHVNPALGKLRVKEVGVTHVQGLLNNIISSKSLAHKVRITLNQIFDAAIMDRLITFNPVKGCEVIAPDDPKRCFLSPSQRELMLELLNNHRSYPIIFCITYTGIRMGEALALLWSDIDFDKNIIRITKAFEYDKSKPHNKDPKTDNGFRDIPVPEDLCTYLKTYQKSVKKGLYVFPGHAGGPMGLTEISRIWKKAQLIIEKWFTENDKKPDNEKLAIEKFNLTFRLLRHTYCTGLYDAGIDEVSAADIMGHDVNIMREIYTHIQESRKKKTAIKIENLYKESKVIDLKESK